MTKSTSAIVSNDIAVFGWVFALAWMAMGPVAMTWLLVRDGPFPGMSWHVSFALLGCFTVAGLLACYFLFAKARCRVSLDGHRLIVKETWLLGSCEEECDQIRPETLSVVHDKDSDGDPYFKLVLSTPTGKQVTIKEGHHLETVNEARLELAAAVGKPVSDV
ncbi:MAG: hypothetical protein JXQ99_11210 [Hyphomicrobiaceae bacterium]